MARERVEIALNGARTPLRTDEDGPDRDQPCARPQHTDCTRHPSHRDPPGSRWRRPDGCCSSPSSWCSSTSRSPITAAATAASVGILVVDGRLRPDVGLLNQVQPARPRATRPPRGVRPGAARRAARRAHRPRQPPGVPGGAGRADHGREGAQPAVRAAVPRHRRPQEDQRRPRPRRRRPAAASHRRRSSPATCGAGTAASASAGTSSRWCSSTATPARRVTTARRMLARRRSTAGPGANAVDPFSLTIGVSAFPQPATRPPAARPPGRRRAVLGQASRADRHPAVRPAATRHGRGLALARRARRRGVAGRRRAAADAGLPAGRTTCGPAPSWATRASSAPCPWRGLRQRRRDVRRGRVDEADRRARHGEPRDGDRGRGRPRPATSTCP